MKKLKHKDPLIKNKNTILTEHQEQASFVAWFELHFPLIKIFAIPNGMRTSFTQASKAKKEGMKKGVPDLYCPYLKMWIEFKRSKGGVVSSEQKEWMRYLKEDCKHTVILARGCMDAITQVMQHIDSHKSGKDN